MITNGLLLIGEIAPDTYTLTLISVSAELASTDVIDLLSDRASNLLSRLQDVANALIPSLNNADYLGIPISAGVDAFPSHIDAGSPFWGYATLLSPQQGQVQTTYGAHLSHIEMYPRQDLLIESDIVSARACYCLTYRALYYRDRTSRPSAPSKPLLAAVERLQRGRLYLPGGALDDSYPQEVIAASNQYSGLMDTYGDLSYFSAWGNVPSNCTWHYLYTSRNYDIEPVLTWQGLTVWCRDTGLGRAAAFSASYPEVINAPWTRVNQYQLAEIKYLTDGDNGAPHVTGLPGSTPSFFWPGVDTVTSVGGIMGVVAVLHVGNIWRPGRN